MAELPVFAADCGPPLPFKVGAAAGRYDDPIRLSMHCYNGWLRPALPDRQEANWTTTSRTGCDRRKYCVSAKPR